MCETESRTFYFAAGVVVCLMVLPASAVAADRLRDRYLDRVNEAEARAVEAAKLLDDAEVLKRLERNAAVPHLSMETAIETSALVKIVKIRRLVKAKPALRKLVERTRAVLQESTRLGVRSHAIMPEAVVESVAENAILSL
ncbi:hypothetical protein HZA56_02440, partial [Candidatus Poribacteria bacterium]|nr:hypothetical protein [Candidatus Poribacteria bacterium]